MFRKNVMVAVAAALVIFLLSTASGGRGEEGYYEPVLEEMQPVGSYPDVNLMTEDESVCVLTRTT